MSLSSDLQKLVQRYERIEIPPIRPVVTQIKRYGCDFPHCGKAQLSAVLDSLAPGSPFGQSIDFLEDR